jgi:hypothetical protein
MKRSSTLVAGGCVLGVLGILKLIDPLFNHGALAGSDPILHVANRVVVPALGAIELTAAALILWGFRGLRAAQLLSGVALAFLAYRTAHALWFANYSCPCLGALGKSIPFFFAAQEQAVLLAVALWLLLIGLWSWLCEACTC